MIRGLSKVPKIQKSSIVEEKTGDRISRSSGEGASKGLSREKKDLREVRRAVQIQVIRYGRHVEESRVFQRRNPL
jgi:hypothetical protein